MGCVAAGGAGWREADLDLEAAVGSGLGGEGGVVCGGDGLDDRESEADAVAVIGGFVPRRSNGWKSRSMSWAGTIGPLFPTETTARSALVVVRTSTRPRVWL